MLAVNLFHMRGGKVLDRREFFWEDLPEFDSTEGVHHSPGGDEQVPAGTGFVEPVERASGRAGRDAAAGPGFEPSEFFSSLLKQLYIGQPYVPRNVYVPVDFEDREMLEEVLSEESSDKNARSARVRILVPQRGDKRSLIDLASNNAKQL